MLGAVMEIAAPPVVIPDGLTAPMASARLLEKLTAPVASEAKVLTWLIGTLATALFNVKAPAPESPSLADVIAPVWVTAAPAVNTVLPPVSMLVMANPSLSVKRMVPAGPVVLPAMAVSVALRTFKVTLVTLLFVAVSRISEPVALKVLTLSAAAVTLPSPKPLTSVVIAPLAVKVALPVVWI